MIPNDTVSRLLAVVHVILILALWIIPVLAYDSLPEKIPAHFDLNGEIDRWDTKSGTSLFLLPAVWTLVGGLLFLVVRFRRAFSYPQKEEIDKLPAVFQTPVHSLNRQFVFAVFVLLGAMFVYIEWAVIASARAGVSTLHMSGVFGPIGLTFVILIAYLVRMRSVAGRAIAAAKHQ